MFHWRRQGLGRPITSALACLLAPSAAGRRRVPTDTDGRRARPDRVARAGPDHRPGACARGRNGSSATARTVAALEGRGATILAIAERDALSLATSAAGLGVVTH